MIKTVGRKALAMLMTLAMVISLMPALTLSASAEISTSPLVFSCSTSANMGQTVSDGAIVGTASSNGIEGIDLVFFNTNDTIYSQNPNIVGSLICYHTDDSATTYPALFSTIDPSGTMQQNPPKILVMKSADGTNFSFKQVYFSDFIGYEKSVKVEGFRNGTSTGSVTLTRASDVAEVTYSTTTDNTGLKASIFQNVDEVRFTNQDGGDMVSGNYMGINNIVVSDPVKVVDATKSTVSASPASIAADGTTTSTITVTLKKTDGIVVSGEEVSLSQGLGSSTIAPLVGKTDGNGQATFTVKSTKAETVTYTATDLTDEVTVEMEPSVTFSSGPALSSTSASYVTSTGAMLNFTSDTAGTYYYLVYAAGDTAPTAAEIKAQGDAVAKGTAAATASTNMAGVTGLTKSTVYKAYVVVVDSSNITSAVSTIDFTTNTPPTFADSGDGSITVKSSASAVDITGLLKVSDSDSSQTLTWTELTPPSCGTLAFLSATATSGGTNITPPTGSITYTRNDASTTDDSFTIQVSDGVDTATRTVNVTVDGTAPTISAAESSHSSSSLTYSLTSNEAGIYYYLVYAAADAVPDAATVKAQGDAVAKGTAAATASANTVSVTGLAESTEYKVYTVVEDAAGNLSEKATVTFTTTGISAPTLTATGGTPIYSQGGTPADLFSSVTAATNDSGQTFSSATLTVSNVSDTTEYLTIGGTEVPLTNGSSGTITGIGSYSVSVTSNTATVSLSGMALSDSEMGSLIDGISYKDDDTTFTAGSRDVTLTSVTDNGGSNNSTTLSIKATVTTRYLITSDSVGNSFYLNGDTTGTSYASLSTVLGYCTGENPYIQLGKSDSTPLYVLSRDSGASSNYLKTATYSGKVVINIQTTNHYGLRIPDGVTATFSGLNVSNADSTYTGFSTVYLSGTGSLNIEDGTITATGVGGKGIFSGSTGTITMTGGTVQATNTTATSASYGIDVAGNTTVNISKGTVSSAGTFNASAGLYIRNCVPTVTISGDAQISGVYGINSSGTGSTGNGSLYITGGTISGKTAVANKSTGKVTIDGGTLTATNIALNNNSTGTIDVKGGTITSSGSNTLTCGGGGIVNLTGGTVSNTNTTTGTNVYTLGKAIGLSADVANVTSIINVSGSVVLSSVSGKIVLITPTSYDTASSKINLFGTTVNGDLKNNSIVISSSSLNQGNFSDATISAFEYGNGSLYGCNMFKGWTSDAERKESIGTANNVALSTLSSTDIYLKAIPKAPPDNLTITPDTDGDKDELSCTISWLTAGNASSNLSGYKIYWGSDSSTKLSSYTSIDSLTTTSWALNNTKIPSGAKYFLVYTYNKCGESESCSYISLTDSDATPPTVEFTSIDSTGKVVTLTFSEAIAESTAIASNFTGTAGTHTVTYTPGALTLTLTYDTAIEKMDGATIIVGAGITDLAGNAITPTTFKEGTGFTGVDTTAPTVAFSSIDSTGKVVTLVFSEPIKESTALASNFTGTAGTHTVAFMGGTTLTLTYSSAIGKGSEATIIVGAGVTDSEGNAINPTTFKEGTTKGFTGVDITAPVVSSVVVPADGSYNAAKNLFFTVNFSKNVTFADGTPYLEIKIGSSNVQASYYSGNNSSAIVFGYTVQAGDTDADGIAVGSLDLNGATLKDVTGNTADTALNSVGSTAAVLVDTTAPIGTITTSTKSPTNATSVPMTVTFTESVTGFEISDISVSNSGTVSDFSGSGKTYTFNINLSAEGEYSVSFASGVAMDTAGNDAAISAPLSITYDKTAPTVSSGTITAGSSTSSAVTLSWTAATDTVTTDQSNLKYKVVFSTSNNISSASDAVSNGTLGTDWTANLTTATVTGLTASTTYYFNVLVKDASGNISTYTSMSKATTAASSGGGSSTGTSTANSGTAIYVNGESKTAGTTETKTDGSGKTTTTVTLDTNKLKSILNSAGSGAIVTVPVTGGGDVASGVLTGEMVKNMENSQATLVIQTDSASYTLPASQINIGSVSQQLGTNVSLSDIKVKVEIAEPSSSMTTVVENAASKGGCSIVVPAVNFTVNCTYNGKTVGVSSFNAYVERTIAVPAGVDSSKITTAIVVEADGSMHSVPTRITMVNGKYYAKINSLTNSTYSVVYNPVEFADVANHWAKTAINDMGSRMVVTGDENGNYNPANNITRAEFATIIVRALGLTAGTTESAFNDVSSSNWYNGYVETATKYGIITGYDSTTFGPNDTLTREQAMTMLARAMKITGLKASLTESEISTLLAGYTDGADASSFAKESVAVCLQTGVVTGTSETTVSPKNCVTRAEVAVMVQRLLKKSELI